MSGYGKVPKTKQKASTGDPDAIKQPNEKPSAGGRVDTPSSLLSGMKRHNLKLLEKALEETSIGRGYQ
jgi:hypothetical protein